MFAPLVKGEAAFALIVSLDAHPIRSIAKVVGIMNKVFIAGLTRWTRGREVFRQGRHTDAREVLLNDVCILHGHL